MHRHLLPRTAFSVVTGFLGAGKTTLLRRLLRSDWKSRNLAFIINDLAEMDVDGQVLSTEADGELSITWLASGCVCCTIKGEFEQTVDQILTTLHPDALIVESSGVANPAAVLHGLNHPDLRLDSVICVIDAERFLQYARLSAAVEWQVYTADFVLVNKAELVTASQLDDIDKRIRQFNKKAAILRTSYCDIPPEVLFGAQAAHAVKDIQALVEEVRQRIREGGERERDHGEVESGRGEFHFHDHLTQDRIDSFVVALDRPLDETRLAECLKSDHMQGVYRAKGFIRLSGSGALHLFNFVPRRFSTEALADGRLRAVSDECFIIFIGRQIEPRRPEIERALMACQA